VCLSVEWVEVEVTAVETVVVAAVAIVVVIVGTLVEVSSLSMRPPER
jgi:hypothetical protein